MVSRRIMIAMALVLGTTGLASGPAGAASGGGSGQFSNLKPIKAPSPCTNDPGVSDTQINVGAILPQTGPSAQSFAASEDGMRARFDVANSSGELGKRKINLTVADDAGDPARNVTVAQQLVEQNNVFGIIENSLAADASAKYLNQKGVPVTGWHLGLASFGKYPNMFGWRNSQPPNPATTFTNRDVLVLKMLGASKIALVGANTSNNSTFIDQTAKAVKLTEPSMKVVYQTTDVPVTQRDFTAEAQKIKDSGADGLYTGMDFLQNVALSAALKQDGYSVKGTVYPGGYDSRVTSLPGIDGTYFGLEVKPFEENPPAYVAYKAAMQKAGKFYQGEIPYIGWLSADTFIEGIKAAGVSCPTRKAFINNLRLEKGWTANGAFAPIDFSEIFGRPFYCTYYVQVQNGAFVPVFGGQPVCANAVINGTKVTKLTPAQQAKG